MRSAKNHAELLFEDYLRSLPVGFEYEPGLSAGASGLTTEWKSKVSDIGSK
jgi:hypothetical protein